MWSIGQSEHNQINRRCVCHCVPLRAWEAWSVMACEAAVRPRTANQRSPPIRAREIKYASHERRSADREGRKNWGVYQVWEAPYSEKQDTTGQEGLHSGGNHQFLSSLQNVGRSTPRPRRELVRHWAARTFHFPSPFKFLAQTMAVAIY